MFRTIELCGPPWARELWQGLPPVKTVGAFSILVFVRLRNSDRNSSFRDSPREKPFLMPISKFLRPGPRTLPLLQLPNLAGATPVKLFGLNHWIPPPWEAGIPVLR